MYTAEQALKAVKNKETLQYDAGDTLLESICYDMVRHINNGWLCFNLKKYNLKPSDMYSVAKFFLPLGYKLDKNGILYWMYNVN